MTSSHDFISRNDQSESTSALCKRFHQAERSSNEASWKHENNFWFGNRIKDRIRRHQLLLSCGLAVEDAVIISFAAWKIASFLLSPIMLLILQLGEKKRIKKIESISDYCGDDEWLAKFSFRSLNEGNGGAQRLHRRKHSPPCRVCFLLKHRRLF